MTNRSLANFQSSPEVIHRPIHLSGCLSTTPLSVHLQVERLRCHLGHWHRREPEMFLWVHAGRELFLKFVKEKKLVSMLSPSVVCLSICSVRLSV